VQIQTTRGPSFHAGTATARLPFIIRRSTRKRSRMAVVYHPPRDPDR
jgi:hypothetical protein